ncbi:unknown [Firmicutes bacterium CAG:321]|nr:unknown [Firmicutes bacterium CAG:321]
MNCYVKSGIAILNDTTKDLKNLNELGIYLAKQTDIDALKSLKLLILASENSMLDKYFDINSVKSYTETFIRDTYKRNESVVGNLSMNPQNIGLELMDYILKNYKIDLTVQPYDSGYTIFDFWARSFARIEDDQDTFYKRYDMIDKKLEIASYMIQNGLLDVSQIDFLLTSFDRCIQRKHSYTREQLLRMQEIFDSVKLKEQLELNVANLITQNKIELNCSKDELVKKLLSIESQVESSSNKRDSWDELSNYQMLNDQCVYMLQTIPTLVKKKVIK